MNCKHLFLPNSGFVGTGSQSSCQAKSADYALCGSQISSIAEKSAEGMENFPDMNKGRKTPPARTSPKQNRSGIGKFAPDGTPISALHLAFLSGTILAFYL
ncbi:MAG: hypothetical protein P4L52_02310 [Acidocella sp.]|nr:hypothetical protein [Acidocella sp.]